MISVSSGGLTGLFVSAGTPASIMVSGFAPADESTAVSGTSGAAVTILVGAKRVVMPSGVGASSAAVSADVSLCWEYAAGGATTQSEARRTSQRRAKLLAKGGSLQRE